MLRQTTHPEVSLPDIYSSSPRQLEELSRLRWTRKIAIAPVPEQYRFEFLSAMVKQNFQRMVNASKVGAIIIGVLIILLDVLEFRGAMPNVFRGTTILHFALCGALLTGYLVGRRLDITDPNRSIYVFFLWANVFRSGYTVITYLLFYTYIQVNPNADIAGAFAIFVGLISAGLYANTGYTLGLAVSNAVLYTGLVVLAAGTDSYRLVDMLFSGYSILAISVFSSSMLFKSFSQEFAMTKSMQEERRKAEELNEQLTGANEEISKQISLLSEQAREIEIANTTLQERGIELERERERATALLYNILPRQIADRLQAGEEHVANHFERVTVMFADIVGFTELAATRSAFEIVSLLNRIFSAFDIFSEQYQLEKIKTIGDAYMIVGGVPEVRTDHAETVAKMAIEMMTTVELLGKNLGVPLQLRIGIHTGSVVAGVIGRKKFAYDLWGDTVNTASRMESHGEAGKIHCSEAVYEALKDKFMFEKRGEIEVKGKGVMRTWFLMGKAL